MYRTLGIALKAFVLSALCALSAQAQTTISGNISASAEWTVANSPYVLSGAVALQSGAVLTIDAGVTVYMGSGSSFTVQSGKVLVQGSSTSPVQVLSDKIRLGQTAAPGDWGQWVMTSGTQSGSSLNYLTIQHGQGLVVNGSTPIFNHVDIRNHQGAAITVDLAASPTGDGNSASGNSINAIVVPAGDIGGTVHWGIKGIPYYLASGTVGVGSAPVIAAVSPSTLQQGETATLTLGGSRLTGATQLTTDNAGVQGQITNGSSASQTTLSLTAATDAPLGPLTLAMLTDAGKVSATGLLTIVQQQPILTAATPSTLYVGQGAADVKLTGKNFDSSSVAMLGTTALTTSYTSSTELHASVPNPTAAGTLSVNLKTPIPGSDGGYFTSNSLNLSVVTPTLQLSPSTQSVPQNASANLSLLLPFAAPSSLAVNLASSNTALLTVPASVTVPAGSSSISFTAQTSTTATGTATVTASRSGFNNGTAQVTVLTTLLNLSVSGLVNISKGQPWSASSSDFVMSGEVVVNKGVPWAVTSSDQAISGVLNISKGEPWSASSTQEVYSGLVNITK